MLRRSPRLNKLATVESSEVVLPKINKAPKVVYNVEFFNGYERDRQRLGQRYGEIIAASTCEATAYLCALEHILSDVLLDDTPDLAIYLKHPDCDETWVKDPKQSPDDPNDMIEVSLWELAKQSLKDDDEKYLTRLIQSWKHAVQHQLKHLSAPKRRALTEQIVDWFDKLSKHGFGKYDPDEGHWLVVRAVKLE